MPTPTTPTTTSSTLGDVETQNTNSSNTHAPPKQNPQESRDLPPLLSSSYPITLKVQHLIQVLNNNNKTH